MVFRIASSPYTHDAQRTNTIMFWVILACIPGIAVQCYFFGYGNLIQIAIAAVVAIAAEAGILLLRKRPVLPQIKDNSALLTAVLLAISIPSFAPWWIITIGTLFAIIVAKQLYGGLGQNPFNPAMVGYVVLLISFPVQMTNWPLPVPLLAQPLSFSDTLSIIFMERSIDGQLLSSMMTGIDGITQATPLDKFKTELTGQLFTFTTDPRTVWLTPAAQILQDPIYTQWSSMGWLWVNVAFLLGGLLLLMRRYIAWQIPFGFLLALTVCSGINMLIVPETSLPPLFHLFFGATMLGAFFIATDPVTASTTPKGRLIFGALIGFLVWLIRTYGGYPDAVAFAVLLANITVPLIDHYTQPRVYGHR